MKKLITFLSILSVIFLVGCAGPQIKLLSIKATSDKLTVEKAFNSISAILVDKGFDVKVANKDIGLVTTEYKKFGAVEEFGPPFDYYLQIKAQVKSTPDGKVQIMMTPIVKEANRLNAAAFTEHELIFIPDDKQKGYLNAQEKTELTGQLLFLNVVSATAEALGIGMEQIEYSKQLGDKPL